FSVGGKAHPDAPRHLVEPDIFYASTVRNLHYHALPVRRKVKSRVNGQITQHPRLLAAPVEPGELRATRHSARLIDQDALLRDGKGSFAPAPGAYYVNLFGDRKSISRRFQALDVERLG